MKRIFTHLFVAVLLMLSSTSWAQSETKTFTVSPLDGSYNKTGWCANWTSNSSEYPVTKIDVAGGINNMNASTTSGGFEMAVGTNGNYNYAWNFSVPGYKIESYSFKFKSKNNNQNINVVAGEQTITSSYSTQQTLTVNDVNAQIASFQLTGSNYAIIVTELTFTVTPILEAGQVYMFKNARPDTDRSLSADGTNDVHTKTTDVNDTKQQWYVTKDGDYYVLRNLACGKYLKGNGQSSEWGMSDDYSHDYNKFELYVSNTTYNTLHTKTLGTHAYMHDSNNGDNGGYNVVGWTNADDAAGSHWTITKVNYTAEQIKALLDAAPTKAETAAYGVALAALFKDGACTELKDEYTSMSVEDIKADANYKALPAVLQNTVLKIKNNNWDEANADATKDAWGATYAKKFRVQMYEPYSIAGDITGFLRMNAHSNNDNPTGIYMPQAGYVYVMVEGEIKDGATLRLHCAGSNSRIINLTGAGYELKSGLNIINIASVANGGDHLYVCYNVDTYNPNGATVDEKFPHKLSEYPPLKIHIEGGAINGFYNACGDFRATTDEENLWKTITGASVDKDADWKYMETRANLSVLPILGHRQILLFQLHDENGQKGMEYYLPENINVPEKPYCYPKTTEWNDFGMGCDSETGKINIFMESWDRIMYSELATLGLVSKDDMDKMNERYPRWNADGTMGEIYDFKNVGPDGKTYQEFCRGLDYSEYFNHHGVSLGGTTGYMSAGWYEANYNNSTFGELMNLPNNSGNIWGPCHEIGHQFQDVFNIRGGTEVTNNVFSNAAIWYQGIATSRYNGGGLSTTLANFNSGLPFIDYNIWSMTQMFYKLWLYYHLAANNTQFYPRFFEMLRIDPLSAKGSIATGTESMLKIYEKMCDASGEDLTEFFRAHGFFVLLDSYPKEDYGITVFVQTQDEVDAAIARVKAKGYKPNYAALLINDMEVTATVRHDGETPRNHYDGPSAEKSEFGSVNDFITGNVATSAYTATVNSDGSITMSGGEGGVGFLVLDKNGKLLSFADKSTFALSEEAKLAVITGKASVVSINSDNSTPVEAVIDLTAMKQTLLADLIADVEAVVANVDDTYKNVGCYKPAAVDNLKTLLDEAKDVYANGTAYEGVYEMLYAEYRKVIDNPNSLIGIISGKKYAIKNRGGNDYMTVSESNVVTTGNSTLPTTDDNLWIIETSGENYHIKHADTGMYLQGVSNDNDVPYTVGNTAVNYMMTRIENAYYALSTVEHFARYMNRHGNKTVATWNTTDANSQWAITLVEDVQDVGDIANLELLVSKTRNLLDKVADVDYTGDAYPLQADDSSSDFFITSNATEGGHEPKYLLDGATATFFHTVWAGTPPGEAHYLQIDLGEGNEIDQFVFSYSTIGQTNVDAPEVIEITGSDSPNSDFQTITTLTSLPTTHLTPYTSDVLGSAGTKYRYLRFTVTDATGGKLGGYYYFGISELAIKRINYKFNNLRDGYESVNNSVVTAAIEQYEAAKQVMANGSGYATALTELQTSYNNLVIESCKILTDKLQSLKTVTGETAALIAQVGSVTEPMSGALALQANNASGAYYISTNADQNTGGGKVDGGGIAALVDNDEGTHFHSRWSGNSVNEPHYIQVDLGTEVDANFQFSYVAHDSPDATIIVVSSSKDGNAFTDIETVEKNLTAVGAKYVSKVFEPQDSYRYLRFAVTSSNGRGYGNKFGDYYCFGMKEFDLELLADLIFTLNSQYSEVVSEELFKSTYFKTEASNNIYKTATTSIQAGSPLVTIEMLDAQIADQQAAKAALEEAMAKLTVDKDALQSLYEDALDLYNAMADSEGNVNSNYAPSALTPEMLATAKSAIDAAKDVLDNSNSQSEIDAAEDVLDEQYNALLGIKNANVATTIDKSGLRTAITNANDLVAAIEAKGDGYYESVAGFGLAELSFALQNAETVVDRFYLTEEQYTEAFTLLNNCYTTTNGIFALDCNNENRNNLATLIGNVNTLLTTIADGGENTLALPLQATNNTEAFYIWCNDPAGDSQGVAGLIDKNADGTANTGTFLGTNWDSDVPAYTHYIEIDLGEAGTIDQLTMDYTTRNSTYADQRPNAIKILGSNDKINYTEITEITSGLAADANEQWSMAESLDLCGHYRYIRVAVGSQRGFFHMADFNLYTKLSHTLKEYYTTAEGLDFVTLCLALDEANDAAAHYMTTEQYTTVYNKLNGCYTTADEIVDNDYKGDRDAFANLRTETEKLVNGVVAIDETETKIALQCTDANAPYYIYCNAPGATNNYSGDNLGVAALLDVDDNGEPITATFLHSSYVNGSHDDNLDHYLRVDMGEAMALRAFKFRYTPRIGNTGNAPLVMLIEGSNDCVNFEEITTLTNMDTTYESDEITNGKAYRYIRFMVKDTHNHGEHDGHKFFAMSHFEMTACKTITISQEHASPNLPVDVAANAYNEVADANALDVEHYLPSETGTTAKNELQAAYDALYAAEQMKNIPVKLTTDVSNPVLYKIRINRSYAEYASLQYDASDSKVAVAAMEFATANAQSWYFMQGTDDNSYDDILILPYVGSKNPNTTLRLAAEDISNGAGKVMAVEENNATYQNWYITVDAGKTAEGWWNIRPEGDNYFSNHSGNGNKMGFWNSSSDDGSEFKFVLDEAYAIVEEAFASYGKEPGYTDVPGYPANSDYNTAYDALANYVENKSGEAAEVFGALQTLIDAKTAMTYVKSHSLEHGAVYRIMNLITNTETQYKYHYIANSGATITFPTTQANDGTDLWVCIKDGDNYKFVSALGTLSLGWKKGAEDAQSYTIADGYVTGAKRMKNGDIAMALTNEKWGKLDFDHAGSNGNKQEPNWSTDWFFQKVDAEVAFNVNISSRRFSSLYLPYNVTVPAGVSAFTAVAVDGGYVDLYRVADNDEKTAAGNIIPARTPVILYIEDDNEVPASSKAFVFEFTADDASLDPAIQQPIIYGNILQTQVECTDGYRYYKLGSKNGDTVSKMYWMYEEYSSDGTIAEGNAGTDDGGYIRCSANKIYMRVQENSAQNAFSMRFAGATTGVDEVTGEAELEDTIYDMQGRKLTEITMPGVYIVNGKKTIVK